MRAVVLSFPGHFFQTLACVRSLGSFYPEIQHISFVLDDIDRDPWHTYPQDFQRCLQQWCDVPHDIFLTSQLESINQCPAGWWRQQLVKYIMDDIIPGQDWFVVDGDTIFETRCDAQGCVPVTLRHPTESNFSKMSENYVRTLLGIDQGHLEHKGTWVCTNAVPFRHLERDFLHGLRQHVENRFQKDFLALHLDWFQDQSIVADWDPPNRMVMSEWELMECYRKYVLEIDLPVIEMGSGYAASVCREDIVQTHNVFRHAYQWDTEIGAAWFGENSCRVDDAAWERSLQWYGSQRDRGHRG